MMHLEKIAMLKHLTELNEQTLDITLAIAGVGLGLGYETGLEWTVSGGQTGTLTSHQSRCNLSMRPRCNLADLAAISLQSLR